MSEPLDEKNLRSEQEYNRRDFLKRVAGASAVALGACALTAALYDSKGPPPMEGGKPLTGLGNYSIPEFRDEHGKMAVVRGTDRVGCFRKAIAALGGMEAFIKKDDRVLIKVNAAFASPPSLGATTHPDILKAVIEACQKAGASQVFVTDNPINNPESCFEISGIAQVAASAGAKLILPKNELFYPVSLPGARLIVNWPVMVGAFRNINKLVTIAPVKDHHRAGASMILKNFYGLLGGRRNVFHQDINAIIAELALLTKPTLAVLDGVVSMVSNGPTGGSISDLKDTQTMIVSTDPVAADACGIELLDRKPEDVPYIMQAYEAGAGIADYHSLKPVHIEAGV